MFKEIGEFITRRPWVVVAIWVIILIIMAPLAMNLTDRLKYDATNFMPKDTDSQQAQNLYAQQFPAASQSSQAELITVIQSDNRTATMGFAHALDAALAGDTSMKNMTTITSVYSAQQMALVQMTPTLYHSMYAAYDSALAAMMAQAANATNTTGAANATGAAAAGGYAVAAGNNSTSAGAGMAGMGMSGAGAGTDQLKAMIVSQVMQSLNLTGDSSYFTYLMSLGDGVSDAQLTADASNWAATHDYNDPQILPADACSQLVNGNVTLYMVSLNADPIKDSDLVSDDVTDLRSQITQVKADGGYADINAYVTGNAAINVDTKSSSTDDMGNIDKYTIIVVLILLLIYFRSILTPFVPLVSIGIAILVTMGVVGLISYFMDFYYIVETIMIVLMMGAGVDYCVFMLSRYAEERRNGADVKSAVVTTVEHAGKSIASSGLTAALGFFALVFSGQGMLGTMGIGVAIGIVISMITGLTLIPAVLTIVGDRMFWPNNIYNAKPRFTLTGMWEGATKFGLKHAGLVILIAVIVVVPAVYVAVHMNTGMDTVSMMPAGVESKVGYTILADSMGTGSMDRAMITVTLPNGITDVSGNLTPAATAQIQTITADIAKINGVDQVYSITSPNGAPINFQDMSSYSATDLAAFQQNLKGSVGADGRTTLIYASFTGSPYSNDAYKAIDDMRTTMNNYDSSQAGQGTTSHVGGESAMMHDVETAMMNGFYIVLPIVIVGIFIILVALLRSILLPIRMIVTLSASIGVTIAAFTLVFQYWQNEVIIFMLPMILVCALLGTGVDYDIFLTSRIREEKLKGANDRDAIVKGVRSTGTIIAICAFIMGGAFATLMISKMQMMQQMGFVLFFGILLNAIVMLLFVVPAIMSLMGKWNWWFPGQKKGKEEEQKPEIKV